MAKWFGRLVIISTCVVALGLSSTIGFPSAHARVGNSVQAPGPAFVYPSNGQTLPAGGNYLFQAEQVSGAVGYLWSFVQGGAIVWENLAFDGTLSSNTYVIKIGSPAYRKLHGGVLQVWVRAALPSVQWSKVTVLTVTLAGRTPLPPPAGRTPSPGSGGRVLYQADWSHGLNGWSGVGWNSVGGLLVADGSGGNTPIFAPYRPRTANYAVEAQLRVDLYAGGCSLFRLVARLTQKGGYGPSGLGCGDPVRIDAIDGSGLGINIIASASNSPSPDNAWHTWRVEVKYNRITFSYDGTVLVSTTDNRFLDPGRVGLLASGDQISVRSFRVIAL